MRNSIYRRVFIRSILTGGNARGKNETIFVFALSRHANDGAIWVNRCLSYLFVDKFEKKKKQWLIYLKNIIIKIKILVFI